MPTNLPVRQPVVASEAGHLPAERLCPWHTAAALCLFSAGATRLVDLYGFVGLIVQMRRILEESADIIGSLPVPFG